MDGGGSRGKDEAIKALLNLEVPRKTPTHHLLRTRGATVSGVTLVWSSGVGRHCTQARRGLIHAIDAIHLPLAPALFAD